MAPVNTAARRNANLTESPAASTSETNFSESDGSEKENSRSGPGGQKRKSTSMSASNAEDSASKRPRLEEQTQPSQRKRGEKQIDTRYYDPDQNPDERRRVKRGLRDLHSTVNDSRAEFLQPDSTGLLDTLQSADSLFRNVKQTADATVDSRLLVTVSDLSYKRIAALTLGDSSVGVDVDDFVTKCISFMKRADPVDDEEQRAATDTQTQRRRRQQLDADDDDNGNTLNWEYLGRNACLLYNSRPCLSGFLLGPLSVQKKVRQQTQRRAREEREEPTTRSRTLQLTEEELDNQEKQSLTAICGEIATLLGNAQEENMTRLQTTYNNMDEDPNDEEMADLMYQHDICDDGGIPLFKFCVNPESFGQTIENLFYVSFLVKEGKAGLGYDKRGLPTISAAAERSLAARQETERKQAVFTMSFETWENIVESFGITKCTIPHREDQVYDDGVLGDMPQPEEPAEDSDMYD